MGNFKVRVNGEAEAEEAQDLFEVIGYKKGACSLGNYPAIIVTTQDWATGDYCSTKALGLDIPAHDKYKELTLPELRAMVNPMKEYLDKKPDGSYELIVSNGGCVDRDWIEVPNGMNYAYGEGSFIQFTKQEMGYRDSVLVWQRTPSLSDQYAEIEQVRQAIKIDGCNDSNHTADAMAYAFMGVDLEQVHQHRHYFIDVSDVDEIDFYEIALRYNVTDPCIQHILKKCLAVGQRGQKDFHHDLKDIYDTAKRMLDVHGLDS